MMRMKNVKIDMENPGTIVVGDVIVHITRVTASSLTIVVDAPTEHRITTSWSRDSKPVET